MPNNQKFNTPQHFDNLFRTLSSDRFLNKEGLGGNRAIFIQPYPISEQKEVDIHIKLLVKRLEQNSKSVLAINLYELCLLILESKNILQKIFSDEKNIPKHEFRKKIRGSLDIEKTVLPAINNLIQKNEHSLILFYGIDKVYPILSIPPILENIQSILNNEPIIFFYPGQYNNFSLNLFGMINEYNEYRAFNLNNYLK